jgi:hypothetical protein
MRVRVNDLWAEVQALTTLSSAEDSLKAAQQNNAIQLKLRLSAVFAAILALISIASPVLISLLDHCEREKAGRGRWRLSCKSDSKGDQLYYWAPSRAANSGAGHKPDRGFLCGPPRTRSRRITSRSGRSPDPRPSGKRSPSPRSTDPLELARQHGAFCATLSLKGFTSHLPSVR